MESINVSFDGLSLNLKDYPSAKIKIDEFFNEWIGSDTTKCLVEMMISEFKMKKDKSHHDPMIQIYQKDSPQYHQQPPRSPGKKSPKKRSHEEVKIINIIFFILFFKLI